jgi:hypothetical protein
MDPVPEPLINRDQLKEYYKDIDFLGWFKLVNVYIDKLKVLKTDKARNIWTLELYTTYLQLVEIFCINIFVLVENDLSKNLFIGNNVLRIKIEEVFKAKKETENGTETFISYLLDNWVFGIKEREKINNLVDKKKMYKNILEETLNDYKNDYQLLNAYKHGFRTKSLGKNNISINRDGNSNQYFIIGEYNSLIIYFQKQQGIIYENKLSFNWQRVVAKSFILLNILENAQKILLADGKKEIILNTLFITDKDNFQKHFGTARFSSPSTLNK